MADTMSTFLTNIGTFFTQAMTWLGDALTVVTSNAPLTVLCLGIPIVGFCVGLLRRMINL